MIQGYQSVAVVEGKPDCQVLAEEAIGLGISVREIEINTGIHSPENEFEGIFRAWLRTCSLGRIREKLERLVEMKAEFQGLDMRAFQNLGGGGVRRIRAKSGSDW